MRTPFRNTRLVLLVGLVLIAVTLSACAPAASGGISCAETYLQHLIDKNYHEAYALLSDYDKQNIPEDLYLRWREAVAQVITIESAEVNTSVDKFPDYKYQGTAIGYALGLKISREQETKMGGIELDGYNQPAYRQMVVYENDQWKMLLLLSDLEVTVAGYEAFLKPAAR
ncbi:MAG: hypothetical protein GX112_12345 [Clostridiaceae bacterium]|jgi:hypothetical protein|nr:hypothetical protein [Clostridiaceae bacterium]